MSWISRLFRREKKRTVMLVMYDKDIVSAVAHKTQSGWKARWAPHSGDQWSILLPDGEVYGTTLVKAWLPDSGWDGTEFSNTGATQMNAEIKKKELETLRARVARLEEALKRGIELHENCDADTCMCGEPMHHPLSDHTPVSMLQYYGDQWAEEAKSALEEK